MWPFLFISILFYALPTLAYDFKHCENIGPAMEHRFAGEQFCLEVKAAGSIPHEVSEHMSRPTWRRVLHECHKSLMNEGSPVSPISYKFATSIKRATSKNDLPFVEYDWNDIKISDADKGKLEKCYSLFLHRAFSQAASIQSLMILTISSQYHGKSSLTKNLHFVRDKYSCQLSQYKKDWDSCEHDHDCEFWGEPFATESSPGLSGFRNAVNKSKINFLKDWQRCYTITYTHEPDPQVDAKLYSKPVCEKKRCLAHKL